MKAVLNKFSSFFLQAGLKETILRFPVSSLCALSLFIIMVLGTHDVLDDDKGLLRLVACFTVGYFWFGGVRLVAESMAWTRGREMLVGFLPYVPFAVLMCLAEDFGMYLIFVIPALLLFLMVAPYNKTRYSNDDDLSFWLYNRYLWSGVLLSFLAIIIMTSGLHAAFASVEALFGVNIPHELMSDIWAFSALLVGPIYALSFVPKYFNYEDQSECEQTPGLMFMLNWILAPLILIYFLILYAYVVKLIVIQELPLGVLAYMVSGFAGVGIATYLVGWPVREKSGALMQKIYKFFFPALIIPVALQFVAIGERIHTFGVTEQRYIVALTAVWLAILVFLFTVRKGTSIKVIPAILMLLLGLAAFGPWGAVGMSGYSQMNRLENLLVQYEILKDGKIVKTDKEIPFEDRKSISSKLEYLHDSNRQERLRRWYPDKTEEEWDKLNVYDMTKEMGFEYVSRYVQGSSEDFFNYYSYRNHRNLLAVKGYDFITQNLYANALEDNDEARSGQKIEADEKAGTPEIEWCLNKENILTIKVEGRGDVVFDLTETVLKHRKEPSEQGKAVIMAEQFGRGMKVRLIFNNMSGTIKDDVPILRNVSFAMLLDL